MTNVLRIAHLKIAHHVCNPEVGKREIHRTRSEHTGAVTSSELRNLVRLQLAVRFLFSIALFSLSFTIFNICGPTFQLTPHFLIVMLALQTIFFSSDIRVMYIQWVGFRLNCNNKNTSSGKVGKRELEMLLKWCDHFGLVWSDCLGLRKEKKTVKFILLFRLYRAFIF